MPFSIFRVRTVAGANVARLLLGAVTFSNFFMLTLYVQQVLGYSALKTGVTFAATAGSAVLWAGVAQSLVTKIGAKPVMAIGFVAFDRRDALVHADPGRRLVLRATSCPATCSSASRSRSRSSRSRSPRSRASSTHEAGLASGLINTAQQVGGAIGVAVASSVSISHFNHLTETGVPFPQALTSGVQWAFWVMFGSRRSPRSSRRSR